MVLDTVEALFAGLPNHAILRAELRRLFRWLKDRGLTAIITGERGDQSLTRYGLEEYVADCVIVLDQRMHEQISTRRLRVLKYRGSAHGTNEYPFMISRRGLSMLPITSLQLDHSVFAQRIPTGIARLDEMLGGKGVYRGSSVLVSGSPGTGKSSIGAKFADTACRRGERVLLFAYEESSAQIVRNMGTIGIDLAQWVKKGLLQIHSSRPTLLGLEEHLLLMHDAVRDFRPSVVVIDPISNLSLDLTALQVKPMLMRLIDFLKRQQITALFASLTEGNGEMLDDSQLGVSSLMDTWLLLRNVEFNGERNRTIYVLKSRGMKHSNQVRELVLSSRGVDLVDVYLGAEHVLTGTARVAQEEQERAAALLRVEEHQHKVKQLASRQKAIAAKIAALQAEADAETAEMATMIARQALQQRNTLQITDTMTQLRGADKTNGSRKKGKR